MLEREDLMKEKKNKVVADDRGSALLTVILVVSFLTILATTLLYITGMNFQIKQMDYRNKKNFYTSEESIETIRARILEDASKAASEAYNDVSKDFVSYGSKDVRTLSYNTCFVTRLQEKWDADLTSYGGAWDVMLQSLVPYGTLEMDSAYDADSNGHFTSAEALDVDEINGKIRIRGLKLTYTNPDGLTTIISTDLDVYAPQLKWDAEGSRTTLESGVDADTAAIRTIVDVQGCVHFANWRKE